MPCGVLIKIFNILQLISKTTLAAQSKVGSKQAAAADSSVANFKYGHLNSVQLLWITSVDMALQKSYYLKHEHQLHSYHQTCMEGLGVLNRSNVQSRKVCTCIHACIHAHACKHIATWTHTDKHTNRDTQLQIDARTHTHKANAIPCSIQLGTFISHKLQHICQPLVS